MTWRLKKTYLKENFELLKMSLNYEKHGNVLFITADGKYDKLLQKIDSNWDEERKVWITSKDNESLILKLQKEILKPGMKNISSQNKYIKELMNKKNERN